VFGGGVLLALVAGLHEFLGGAGAEGRERRAAKAFILGNMDDPQGIEFLGWGKPRFVVTSVPYRPSADPASVSPSALRPVPEAFAPFSRSYQTGVILRLKWRYQEPAVRKGMQEEAFLIQEGCVTQVAAVKAGDVDPFRNTAAERVGDKWTRVVVWGRLTHRGKPIRLAAGPGHEQVLMSFGRGVALPALQAEVMAPHYEMRCIPPGKYQVGIDWPQHGFRADLSGVKSPVSVDRLGMAYQLPVSPLYCELNDREPVQHIDFDLQGDLKDFRLDPGN
jgi:hypothetical protein